MPVEGQWQRLSTPLSRRDRRLISAMAVAAALAAAAVVFFAVRGSGTSNAGCVVVDLPSTMGGAHLSRCGAEAHAFCRSEAPRDRVVADACRRQGFLADLAP